MSITRVTNRLNRVISKLDDGFVQTRVVTILANNLLQLTPVDTGLARSNYFVSVDNPSEELTDKTDGQIKGLERAVQAKRFKIIWISNNLPYIERLDQGWSSQAPNGFVEQALRMTTTQVQDITKGLLE